MACKAPKYDSYDYIAPAKYVGALTGKSVIVTGGSMSIGLATAKSFAKAGAAVAIVARNEADLATALQDIQSTCPGARVCTIAGDVNDPSFPVAAVKKAKEELGCQAIDILVNNAAVQHFDAFWAEPNDLSDWWRTVEITLSGPVRFTKAVFSEGGMVARKSGIVISTGSDQGYITYAGSSAYGVAKSGLFHFHHTLELETRRHSIVNYYVDPGWVDSRMTRSVFNNPKPTFIEELESVPERLAGSESFSAGTFNFQASQLGADTMVALCVDKDAHLLSGTYVDSRRDLGELLEAARQGDYEKGLYTMGLQTLDGHQKWTQENSWAQRNRE